MPAIGLLTLELHVNGSHSLKEKRQVVRALRDRLRKRYNVSIAETAHQDSWQRARIDIAAVAADAVQLESRLQRIEEEAETILGGDLLDSFIELF